MYLKTPGRNLGKISLTIGWKGTAGRRREPMLCCCYGRDKEFGI